MKRSARSKKYETQS